MNRLEMNTLASATPTGIGQSPDACAYTVACVTTDQGLAALRCEWNHLAGDQPFLSWDWCECWWRHYRTTRGRLWVLTVRNAAGQLVGLAPWLLHNTLTQGRVVKFLGANEVCGDRLTIASTPEHRLPVVHAVADWLTGKAAEQWDLLELTGVENGDPSLTELAARLQHHGHATHVRQTMNCWRIELPATWEDFLKLVSKQRRMRIRKILREKLDAGLASHRAVQSEDELAGGFDLLVALHQRRRNMLGESGCFASDRFTAFHAEYARRLLAQDKLHLSITELAGTPAAVGYDFTLGDTMYHYQSGFEPALADEHPGWLNLAATLRWAIERGIKRFDMLRGDESYKASFAAQPVPLIELRVVGRRASSALLHKAWLTQTGFKKWVRKGLNRAATWNRKCEPPLPQSPLAPPSAPILS